MSVMHKQGTVMCRDHARLAGYAVVTQECHSVGVLARTQNQWLHPTVVPIPAHECLSEKYVQWPNTDIA